MSQEEFRSAPEQLPQRELVRVQIEKLHIPFRPEEHPDLWIALTETGEHFDDALGMTRMVDALWPKLGLKGISREKLMISTLLHDVGKSGPDRPSPQLREVIKTLFVPPQIPFNPFRKEGEQVLQKTIRDFIRETNLPHGETIERILKDELGMDSTQKSILDFWRDHIDWTYDILTHHKNGLIDDEVAIIASSHHILEGRNPAHITVQTDEPGFNPFSERAYPVLVILDKYHAFRDRGGLDHAKAIEALRKIIERNQDRDPAAKHEYIRLIDILEQSEDALTAALQDKN